MAFISTGIGYTPVPTNNTFNTDTDDIVVANTFTSADAGTVLAGQTTTEALGFLQHAISTFVVNHTWVPADGSGAALVLTTNYAKDSRVSNILNFTTSITYPVTVDVSAAIISGLPKASARIQQLTGSLSSGQTISPKVSGSTLVLLDSDLVALTNANLSTLTVLISGTYQF